MASRHLFVSPHLDDVALSCGGLITTLANRGEQVDVITLMSGDAPTPLPDSSLVEKIHERWDRGSNPMAARRDEDQQALVKLGARAFWHDWRDCIYRTDAQGNVLYQTDDDIFGDIHTDDPLLNRDVPLNDRSDVDQIYLPLGAGNHVDHQLVRAATLRWIENDSRSVAIFFYEEYPYSSEAGEVLRSHSGQHERLQGANAIDRARSTLRHELQPVVQEVSEAALKVKIDAIACYASQISTFWTDVDEMAARVRENAMHVGATAHLSFGERLWEIQ